MLPALALLFASLATSAVASGGMTPVSGLVARSLVDRSPNRFRCEPGVVVAHSLHGDYCECQSKCDRKHYEPCPEPIHANRGEPACYRGECNVHCINNFVPTEVSPGKWDCLCDRGYVPAKDDKSCICPSPYSINKNGDCVLQPSQKPQPPKEPCDKWGNPIHGGGPHHRRTTTRQGTVACPANETLCPIIGGSGEGHCVDTSQELDNCGGCASTGQGQDCTQMVGAAGVGCEAGRCVALSCLPGFSLGFDDKCKSRGL